MIEMNWVLFIMMASAQVVTLDMLEPQAPNDI